MDAILKDIGIVLGADEPRAWKRRNDAAHGVAMETGEELGPIRDIKLRGRMLLRMINRADTYHDMSHARIPDPQTR